MATSVNIKEIENAVKKLKKLPDAVSQRSRKIILRKAAEKLVTAAKGNINVSAKPHYRYKTAKAAGSIRAPKGSGQVVATYLPGNLAQSIQVLNFRKAKTSVYIGPKVDKGTPTGTFGGGGRVDAYYAHMVEFGSINNEPEFYMRRAFNSTSSAIANEITNRVAKKIKDFARKNKV